jgi:hypothetical protein
VNISLLFKLDLAFSVSLVVLVLYAVFLCHQRAPDAPGKMGVYESINRQ